MKPFRLWRSLHRSLDRGSILEEGPCVLHEVVGLPHLLPGPGVGVDLHLGEAVVGHLTGQMLVQLLLRDELSLLLKQKTSTFIYVA